MFALCGHLASSSEWRISPQKFVSVSTVLGQRADEADRRMSWSRSLSGARDSRRLALIRRHAIRVQQQLHKRWVRLPYASGVAGPGSRRERAPSLRRSRKREAQSRPCGLRSLAQGIRNPSPEAHVSHALPLARRHILRGSAVAARDMSPCSCSSGPILGRSRGRTRLASRQVASLC